MVENKQRICDFLVIALRETRNLADLQALDYDAQHEVVTATFADGAKKYANVAMDSGTSMIRDIIIQIV